MTLGWNNLRSSKSTIPVSHDMSAVSSTNTVPYFTPLKTQSPPFTFAMQAISISSWPSEYSHPGILPRILLVQEQELPWLLLVTCSGRMEPCYLSSCFHVKPQSRAIKSSCSGVRHIRDENLTLPRSSYVTSGVWINLYRPQLLHVYLSHPLNMSKHIAQHKSGKNC